MLRNMRFFKLQLLILMVICNMAGYADKPDLFELFARPLSIVTSKDIKTEIQKGARVNARQWGITPLFMLVRKAYGNEDITLIEALLEAGAEVNTIEYGLKMSLLMDTVLKEDCPITPSIIGLLVKAGAKVNAQHEKYGSTALFLAVSHKNPIKNPTNIQLEIVKALLASGADVNIPSKNGVTPLMIACGSDTDPRIISLLLKAGAKARLTCNLGNTALDYAENNEFLQESSVLEDLKRVTLVKRSTTK